MDELSALKEQRMAAMQKQLQEQAQEQAMLEQKFLELEKIIKTLFTKEALVRYGNLKTAHPNLAMQVIALIGQMVQGGKVPKITDDDLKLMLTKLQPKKRDITIRRR